MDGVLDEYVSHLPMLVLAKKMVYRIIPTLIYPVKHHDKDLGGSGVARNLFMGGGGGLPNFVGGRTARNFFFP